jgi:hypothetical protein
VFHVDAEKRALSVGHGEKAAAQAASALAVFCSFILALVALDVSFWLMGWLLMIVAPIKLHICYVRWR